MYMKVVRSYRFEAAHHLEWHPGKCSRQHGHSYRLEVTVEGPVDDRGVVVDFADVDAVVDHHVIDVLDHTDLNALVDNPTAEVVAVWIGNALTRADLAWTSLRLWETERGSVVLQA